MKPPFRFLTVMIVLDLTQVTGAIVTGPWHGRSVRQTTARVIAGVAINYTGFGD